MLFVPNSLPLFRGTNLSLPPPLRWEGDRGRGKVAEIQPQGNRMRILSLIALGSLLLSALAGCGGSTPEATDTKKPTETTTTSTATPTETKPTEEKKETPELNTEAPKTEAAKGDKPTTIDPSIKLPAGAEKLKFKITPSGLQYADMKEGTGNFPQEGQTVVTHYTGTLTDGTVFDSSKKRGEPLPFTLGTPNIIKSWNEAVATMKPGGKRVIVSPAALAYGEGGRGPIPPNATLVFEIELLEAR
jgi:peptidylprolyl isomerase